MVIDFDVFHHFGNSCMENLAFIETSKNVNYPGSIQRNPQSECNNAVFEHITLHISVNFNRKRFLSFTETEGEFSTLLSLEVKLGFR